MKMIKLFEAWSQTNEKQAVNTPNKMVHNGKPDWLRTALKDMGSVYMEDISSDDVPNPHVTTTPTDVTITYTPSDKVVLPNDGTNDNYFSLSYIYSDTNEVAKVLDKVKLTNNIVRTFPYNIGKYQGLIVVIGSGGAGTNKL